MTKPIEIASLEAMNSVDYIWIWKVFLEQEAISQFTLSCEHVYAFDGPLRGVSSISGISQGTEFLDALNELWYEMIDDAPSAGDIESIAANIQDAHPELAKGLRDAKLED
jgi:hypothetical protein